MQTIQNINSSTSAVSNFSAKKIKSDIEVIAQTDYYSISYLHSKNRFYLVLKNSTDYSTLFSSYLEDWKKAMLLAIPNFTLLTDATNVKIIPPSVMNIHNQAQQIIVDAGLLQVAEVFPNDAFLEYQAELLSENSQMPRAKFNTIELAEKWLDDLQK